VITASARSFVAQGELKPWGISPPSGMWPPCTPHIQGSRFVPLPITFSCTRNEKPPGFTSPWATTALVKPRSGE